MNHNKTDKDLEGRLLSGRDVTVITALKEVRVKGNASYIPVMLALLNASPEPDVEKELLNILGSLKTQDAVPVMAGALQEPRLREIRKKITAACWQNGLDYRNYLPVFIDIIIEEDWETGFEAFTVIENMDHLPGQEVIDLSVEKINKAISKVNENQKKYLLEEVLGIIS